jgi:hypothetical protein
LAGLAEETVEDRTDSQIWPDGYFDRLFGCLKDDPIGADPRRAEA